MLDFELLGLREIIRLQNQLSEVLSRRFERHLALMAGAPDLGLTFSFSEYLAENGAPTGQLLLTRCRRPGVRDLIRRNHIGNGSTPVVRKDVFRIAGLFDESLGSCEDFEMWVRSAACTPLRLGLLRRLLARRDLDTVRVEKPGFSLALRRNVSHGAGA